MNVPPPVCFVLLVHKSPAQVGRLIDVLQPCPVLVHLDGRAGEQVWDGFQDLAASRPQVKLIDRTPTGWASWGAVQAFVQGLERSLDLQCSHVVHMTGQDYPLRPVDEIAAFLARWPGYVLDPPPSDAGGVPFRRRRRDSRAPLIGTWRSEGGASEFPWRDDHRKVSPFTTGKPRGSFQQVWSATFSTRSNSALSWSSSSVGPGRPMSCSSPAWP